MIREICFFLRYGPEVERSKKKMGLATFLKQASKQMDADGYGPLREYLVGQLAGEVLELGAGTGATFPYYKTGARVTAVEPDSQLRAVAMRCAEQSHADIHVIAADGRTLPVKSGVFDHVVASQVLCSMPSPDEALIELKRVLRPGGCVHLMEHVRSDHWLAGPLLDMLDPAWSRLSSVNCHVNRRTLDSVKRAGFIIDSIRRYKIYSKAAPAVFPGRIIKAKLPVR